MFSLNNKKIKTLILISLIVVPCGFSKPQNVQKNHIKKAVLIPDYRKDVISIAKNNGFNPSDRIINAILNASKVYKINHIELTTIAIIETGLGKYVKTRNNSNGTKDKGLFQINTINWPKCVEYNLDSPEGSALCAAKLLSQIKSKRSDYLGVYHSKTPSKKNKYLKKITKVIAKFTDK